MAKLQTSAARPLKKPCFKIVGSTDRFITFRVIRGPFLTPGLRLGDCSANRRKRRAIVENDCFAVTLDAQFFPELIEVW